MSDLDLPTLKSRLAAQGLNVTGVTSAAGNERHLPGARSAMVVASAGEAMWDSFLEAVQRDPALLEAEHPLEAFVRGVVASADPEPGAERTWVFADVRQQDVPDFQSLAIRAGLGWRSRLKLVLHPRFGPWQALRAVMVTTAELPQAGPLPGEGPCNGCSRPCASACPAGALNSGELSWRRCLAYRALVRRCDQGCAARRACPVGEGYRYSSQQLRYHADPRKGRKELVLRLGGTLAQPSALKEKLEVGRQWLGLKRDEK